MHFLMYWKINLHLLITMWLSLRLTITGGRSPAHRSVRAVGKPIVCIFLNVNARGSPKASRWENRLLSVQIARQRRTLVSICKKNLAMTNSRLSLRGFEAKARCQRKTEVIYSMATARMMRWIASTSSRNDKLPKRCKNILFN